MKKLKSYLSNFIYATEINLKNAPIGYTLSFMLCLIYDLLGLWFNVYFIAHILKLLEIGAEWNNIIKYCILGIVVVLLQTVILEIYQLVKTRSDLLSRKYIQTMVYKTSLAYKLGEFHSPSFFDEYTYVIEHASGYITKSWIQIYNIFLSVVYASVFVTELIGLNVKILITALVLLAAKFLTDYFLTSKQNDIAYKNSMNMQPFKRKEAYFRRLFFIKKNAYDMKTPSLSKLFKDEYLKSTEETLQRQIENNKSEVRISMIKTLYNKAFSNIIVVLILIWALKCSGLDDVSVYWKISAFFTSMFGLGILQIPAEIKNYSNYIGKIRSFLEVRTEPFRADCTKAPHILLKNISFSYDENSEFSLKNINMDIEAGKTIAIVGKNGSGKTTLLNILLGLYNPTSGEITVDGINLSKFDLIDNQLISLLSQNFNIYFASIRDNVTMGKVGFSDDAVLDALTLSECDEFFNKFNDGLDTKIGRQFDENAVELSGGQSQRIALARVFLSESPLVFLDEPTSAIDPIFETSILENLEKKLKGKTAVMITHRLIMTKLANRIYVMDNGRIIEEGSFAELMELKGMFYDMYKFQESR